MEEIRELKERLEGERPVEWEALPDIGLYMDQLISYMPRQLIRYGEGESLTSAMVNNYIKDGAMPRAEGKRYSRTHLAYLTALCALKQVLSVKDAGLLLAAVLLALTNWVKPTKKLHPIVFIGFSAVVGVVFRFAGV